MRILLIAPDIPDYCIAFAQAVATSADVVLIAPQSYFKDRMVPESLRLTVHQLDWPRHRSLRNPLFLRRLFATIRGYKPDLIHILNEKNIWLNALLPFLRGLPIVTTVHDVLYHPGDAALGSVPQWCTRLFICQSDAIIVHGKALRQQAVSRLPVPEHAIHIVPHVALPFYRDLASRERLQPAAGRVPTVLFFGRIRRYKGVDVLISAAARVASEIAAVQFVIAGRSDRATQPCVAGAVAPLFDVRDRFIPDSEAAQLFLDADLLVLPYTEASQSGVLAIANTFGLPAVATDVGDIGMTVTESGTGIVVPARNPEALAQAIFILLRDQELRAKLSKNAQKLASLELSPAGIGAKAAAVYDHVLKSARRSRAGDGFSNPDAS